jgi:hypothetical protein
VTVKIQAQIAFLKVPPNEAVEALIRENVAKPDTVYGGIRGRRVVSVASWQGRNRGRAVRKVLLRAEGTPGNL